MAPDPGSPADGAPDSDAVRDRVPDGRPESREAFGRLLGTVGAETRLIYDHLGRMADDLERAAEAAEARADWLDAMGEAHALRAVWTYLLSARHKLHGALTEVSRGRPEDRPRRHP